LKWIEKRADKLFRLVDCIVDSTQLDLATVTATGTCSTIKDLKKRQLVEKRLHLHHRTHCSKVMTYNVQKGAKFSTVIAKEDTDITSEMLAS